MEDTKDKNRDLSDINFENETEKEPLLDNTVSTNDTDK